MASRWMLAYWCLTIPSLPSCTHLGLSLSFQTFATNEAGVLKVPLFIRKSTAVTLFLIKIWGAQTCGPPLPDRLLSGSAPPLLVPLFFLGGREGTHFPTFLLQSSL